MLTAGFPCLAALSAASTSGVADEVDQVIGRGVVGHRDHLGRELAQGVGGAGRIVLHRPRRQALGLVADRQRRVPGQLALAGGQLVVDREQHHSLKVEPIASDVVGLTFCLGTHFPPSSWAMKSWFSGPGLLEHRDRVAIGLGRRLGRGRLEQEAGDLARRGLGHLEADPHRHQRRCRGDTRRCSDDEPSRLRILTGGSCW
jgi:hypothetical protein